MRVHLARGLSPYSFRVSRVLVKRASRSQENIHFHAYYLFMNFRELWVRWIVTPIKQWRELQLSNETKSTILKADEQYVPYKKISGRWHVPWLTPPLKRAIRKKQRLYRKAKHLQTHEKKKSEKQQRASFWNLQRLELIGFHNKPWPSHPNKKGQCGDLFLEGKRKRGGPAWW